MATRTTASVAPPASLWRLTAPALVWLAHFVASYATAATTCGRWASGGGPATGWIVAYTAAALLGLAGCLPIGVRAGPVLEPARALDDDHPASREAFVATTNALLVLAGGLGVVAVGAAAVLVPTCR